MDDRVEAELHSRADDELHPVHVLGHEVGAGTGDADGRRRMDDRLGTAQQLGHRGAVGHVTHHDVDIARIDAEGTEHAGGLGAIPHEEPRAVTVGQQPHHRVRADEPRASRDGNEHPLTHPTGSVRTQPRMAWLPAHRSSQ